jgi:hypothetical protein
MALVQSQQLTGNGSGNSPGPLLFFALIPQWIGPAARRTLRLGEADPVYRFGSAETSRSRVDRFYWMAGVKILWTVDWSLVPPVGEHVDVGQGGWPTLNHTRVMGAPSFHSFIVEGWEAPAPR